MTQHRRIDPDREIIDAALHRKRVIAPVKSRQELVQERRSEVKRLLAAGWAALRIADHLGVSTQTVHNDKEAMGLVRRRERNGGDKAREVKEDRARRGSAAIRDRRRFKTVAVPYGEPSVFAPEDATGTMFPSRVFTPDGQELVLKDGCNNSKIGGDVLVGRLKGAYIATLTLEERATCPRSCPIWRGCYGNTMQHSRRWRPGEELEAQLRLEVAMACAKNDLVLIRLHILGDFYSWEYLCLWAELLDNHPGLHIFGFTAHRPGTRIGDGIARLRATWPDRFMIRHSGLTGRWGSFTLPFPTDRKQIGDAIVCPEQLDAMAGGANGTHCGSCAACWSTDRPIAFVEH